ncbi:MAG: Zn-dependent peptidase ImmA (M78 family) [Myxococcota bacterium]|jgi:Zn-dependent peptidase ImmA (M78 family)
MEAKIRALIERASEGDLRRLSNDTTIGLPLLEQALAGALAGWTTGMVERLARVAGVDPAAVWAQGPLPAAPSLAFLRGSWPDFHQGDMRLLTRALEAGCTLRAMSDLLAADIGARYRPSRVSCSPPFYEDGYRLARQLRAHLGAPTSALPNLYDLAGGLLDVFVASAPLHTARLEAVTVYSSEGAAIVLNHRVERRGVMRRRTLAHELCHALYDEQDSPADAVLEQDSAGEQDASPREQRARAFAAELLVPLAGLNEHLGIPAMTTHTSTAREYVATVSSIFGAPPELVANHLANHRYVHLDLREALVAHVAGTDIAVADEASDWLSARVLEAADAEHITGQRGSELITLFSVGNDLAA